MPHKPAYMELEHHELLNVCKSVKVEVTQEMAHGVEKETQNFGSIIELAE